MTIYFSSEGEVIIQMDDYIRNILEEANEDTLGTTTTPAEEHQFKVINIPQFLDEDF